MRSRQRRRYDGELYGDALRAFVVAHPRRKNKAPPVFTVTLAGEMRLTRNMDDALGQLSKFEKLELPLDRMTYLHVKLDDVVAFDAPAVLFLASRLHALRARPNVIVSGTYPKHPKAQKALRDAGFADFLKGVAPQELSAPVGVQLEFGDRARHAQLQPKVALKMLEFLAGLNGQLSVEDTDMLGLAVNEALENVQRHAYVGMHNAGWCVVGLHDDDTGSSSVAIIDTGVGIKKTVQRKALDRLQPLAYLVEATSGLRTASGDPKHGKGLKTLSDFATSAPNRQFYVVSSKAAITWNASGPSAREAHGFRGTIVCLELEAPHA